MHIFLLKPLKMFTSSLLESEVSFFCVTLGPADAAVDLEEFVRAAEDNLGGEEATLLPWSNFEVEEDDGVLMLDDEALVLEEFFLLLLLPDINRSPLDPPSSPPLRRLFLFSLLLPSNLDTSLSSLPRNFSDEPGDLMAARLKIKTFVG